MLPVLSPHQQCLQQMPKRTVSKSAHHKKQSIFGDPTPKPSKCVQTISNTVSCFSLFWTSQTQLWGVCSGIGQAVANDSVSELGFHIPSLDPSNLPGSRSCWCTCSAGWAETVWWTSSGCNWAVEETSCLERIYDMRGCFLRIFAHVYIYLHTFSNRQMSWEFENNWSNRRNSVDKWTPSETWLQHLSIYPSVCLPLSASPPLKSQNIKWSCDKTA